MNRLFTNIWLGAALLTMVALAAASVDTAFAQAAPPSAATPVAASDATIKSLQEALSRQGIAVKVDGVLSEETRAAIRKYQSQHHLPVTGEPDAATLAKLGVAARQATGTALAQATPTPPGGTPPQAQAPVQQAPQMPMQPGQMQGGMMMNRPMMQGQMQMMQGQMQAMMQMMQTMQGQAQPGQMQPGQMQPGQMQPGQVPPGAR